MFETKGDSEGSQPEITKEVPVVHEVVIFTGNLHHLLHGDDPEGGEEAEGKHVEPVVIPIERLLSIINWFFQCIYFRVLLVEDSFNLFQGIILVEGQLVNFTHEYSSHEEIKWHGGGDCNQGCPQDHNGALACRDVVEENGEDAAFPGKSDEHEGGSGEFGKVLFVAQIM